MISIVTTQTAKNSDAISPLAITPRVRQNTTPTPQGPLRRELPAGKNLFDARVVLAETPDDTCPSDDAKTNIFLSHNAPLETFREQLFS